MGFICLRERKMFAVTGWEFCCNVPGRSYFYFFVTCRVGIFCFTFGCRGGAFFFFFAVHLSAPGGCHAPVNQFRCCVPGISYFVVMCQDGARDTAVILEKQPQRCEHSPRCGPNIF
ncbi:unnamed protein product [Pylaiella littoralis]